MSLIQIRENGNIKKFAGKIAHGVRSTPQEEEVWRFEAIGDEARKKAEQALSIARQRLLKPKGNGSKQPILKIRWDEPNFVRFIGTKEPDKWIYHIEIQRN